MLILSTRNKAILRYGPNSEAFVCPDPSGVVLAFAFRLRIAERLLCLPEQRADIPKADRGSAFTPESALLLPCFNLGLPVARLNIGAITYRS
jgi:hypothetical protein